MEYYLNALNGYCMNYFILLMHRSEYILKSFYEGCSIYNFTMLITFTFYKVQRHNASIINIKINHFCSRPPNIRQFRQTVMKWQQWQHDHVAVIALHFLTSRRY